MDFFSIITLGGGLAMFLYGMDLMGDGLKSSSASTLKTVLGKVTSNAFTGFLLGLLITALIQSSTATIVICVGLLGAGMLNIKQTISITIGANVGTTITAQIIRLLDVDGTTGTILRILKPDTLAPLALIIGIILMMAIKKDSVQNIGKIAVGFGILFVGLLTMTESMEPLADSVWFQDAILRLSNTPIITLLIAMVFTAIIASSSATVGVLQTLCSTGLITFRMAYFYVVGAAIGTCLTTAFLCSIGTKADSKRVAFMNVLFNVIGAAAFVTIMEIVYNMGLMPNLWNASVTSGSVADFQTLFKLANAIIFLPFIPVLIKISMKVIKDDPTEKKKVIPADRFDTHLFKSPALALRQCEIVVGDIGEEVKENFNMTMKQIIKFDKGKAQRILDTEEYIDELTDRCSQYLIELSPHVVSDRESEELGDLLQSLSEFERIGDLALNIQESAQAMDDENLKFSDTAKKEAVVLERALSNIIGLAQRAFKYGDADTATKIEPLEEVIDDLVEYARESHISRLKSGLCSVDGGIAFLDMLTNMERIGDQCSNLALMVLKHKYPDINKHEYIKYVHSGASEDFNKEYARLRKEYMDDIQSLDFEIDEYMNASKESRIQES